MQLIDALRLFHPPEKDYTFYSIPHKQYSRINYFLIPHSQLHAIHDSLIRPITWSDHAPVLLSYALTDTLTSRTRAWRLNEILLQDEEVKDVIREIDCYFQTNNTLDSNPGMVWEAEKAVIRGVLIKHGSHIKKQRTTQMTSLLKELSLLEARHKHAQTPYYSLEIKQQYRSAGRSHMNLVINAVNF